MGSTIGSEAYIFFVTLYGGIIMGFIYDVYRIFRYFFKPKKVATFIEDLIFWIIVSVVALIILFFSNWGELRGFEFLGFIGGAFLYHKLLSKLVITVIVYIIRYIIKAIRYIFGIILYPFKLLGNVLYKPYQLIASNAKGGYKRIRKLFTLPGRVFKDIKKYTKAIILRK